MRRLRAGELDVLSAVAGGRAKRRLVQKVLLYGRWWWERQPQSAARPARVSYQELAQADGYFHRRRARSTIRSLQLFTQHGLSRPRSYVQSVSFLMSRTLMVENGTACRVARSVVRA